MYSHACREKNSGFVRLRHCSFRWEIRLYFLGGRKNRFCEAEALFFLSEIRLNILGGEKSIIAKLMLQTKYSHLFLKRNPS